MTSDDYWFIMTYAACKTTQNFVRCFAFGDAFVCGLRLKQPEATT